MSDNVNTKAIMKKICKILSLCLVCAVALVIFTGCEDPEEVDHIYDSYSILGDWTTDSSLLKDSFEIEFYKLGRWSASWKDGYSRGSFELRGNRISLIQGENENYWDIVSITSNTMLIDWIDEGRILFTRK